MFGASLDAIGALNENNNNLGVRDMYAGDLIHKIKQTATSSEDSPFIGIPADVLEKIIQEFCDQFIYSLCEDDIRAELESNHPEIEDIDKFIDDHKHSIRKGVEAGLKCWSEVMNTAVQNAVDDCDVEDYKSS